MSDDELDDRLGRAGRAWRQDLPSPSEPQQSRWSRGPRHWLVPMAAAASVVLVAGGLLLAQHVGDDGDGRPAAPVTGTASVVPWADLPPTHPKMPVHLTGGVSAAQLAAAPRCGPGDLVVGRAHLEGAAGTSYLYLNLRLAGAKPCRIDAHYPQVVLETATGTRIHVATSPTGLDGSPPRLVLLTRAHPAGLAVGWARSHDCRNLDNTAISWSVAGLTFRTGGFGRTSCNHGDGPQDPFVLPVASSYHVRRTSPYDGLDVTGDLKLTGTPGKPVDFMVTLTSRRDLVLDPCPDLRISAYTGRQGTDTVHEHALNCADVPYRTTAGTPYLPAGVPVSFAMQVIAPLANAPKLTWELIAPPSHPATSGSLIVGTHPPDGEISGVVTMSGGPAGAPATKVTSGLVIARGGGHWYKSPIGADGSYRIELPAGAYDLTVRTPAWNGGATYRDGGIGVTGGATTDANISLPRR